MRRFSVLSLFAAMMVALGPNAVAQEALDKSIYWSPEENGMTPISTETLEDGTVVTHYPYVRVYKKPNGDFASFPQIQDTRDLKTLEIVKGTTFPVPKRARAVGAFRLTMPEGTVYSIETSGPLAGYFTIRTKDGGLLLASIDPLIDKEILSTIDIDGWYTKDKSALRMLHNPLHLMFSDFMDPYPSMLTDFNIELRGHYAVARMDFYETSSISNGEKDRKKVKFNYYIDYNQNTDLNIPDRELLLISNRFPYFSDYWYYNGERYVVPSGIKIGKGEYTQLWKLTDTGLLPFGAKSLESGNIIIDKGGRIGPRKEDHDVDFKNGDFYGGYSRSDSKLTMSDGTVVEQFKGYPQKKVTFPNGDKYVGTFSDHDNELYHHINKFEFSNNEPNYDPLAKFKPFYDGTLTKADGKEYTYSGGVSEAERQAVKAELQKILNKLYAKYGKANVDSALKGNVKVGMSIDMLIALGASLQKADEGSSYAWYKMATEITYGGDVKYKWIRVKKSTGKIDYIGAQRTGGFMSY